MNKTVLLSLLLFLQCNVLWSVNKELDNASIAYFVTDDKGHVIAHKDEQKSLTPASITKTLTTATVLEMYGGYYRFRTVLQYDGTIGKDGMLDGNIYIKGEGDPTLGSCYFETDRNLFLKQWMETIQKVGIQSVNGKVIADESYFDREGVSAKWIREDIGNYFAAGAYGVSVYDNRYVLVLKSGGVGSKAEIVRTDPEMKEMRFVTHVKAAANTKDSVYINGEPFSMNRTLFGTMPANQTAFAVKGDIPDPALFLATLVRNELIRKGVSVKGEATSYRLLDEQNRWKETYRTDLCVTESPALSEIVAVTNHESNNMFAEHLIKQIGMKGKGGSSRYGVWALKDYWAQRGVSTKGVMMQDGCGLSPMNAITPRFFVDVLNKMRKSKEFATFENSLTLAGDPESSIFLANTRLKQHARFKSGSFSGVLCYVGYVTLREKKYTFAVMVNHFDVPQSVAKAEIENILLQVIPR